MSKTAAFVLVHLVLTTAMAIAAEPAANAERPPLSPMMQEIRQTLDAARIRVEELDAALENVTDEAAALAMLEQVRQIKQDAEIDILRIQLRYATEAGDTKTVAEIETAIDRALAPESAQPTPQAGAEREQRVREADHD